LSQRHILGQARLPPPRPPFATVGRKTHLSPSHAVAVKRRECVCLVLEIACLPRCLPSSSLKPPSGSAWVHEIKHDGYRLIARRDGKRVRLFTRRGYDWSGSRCPCHRSRFLYLHFFTTVACWRAVATLPQVEVFARWCPCSARTVKAWTKPGGYRAPSPLPVQP
jgi:hypothetical protein